MKKNLKFEHAIAKCQTHSKLYQVGGSHLMMKTYSLAGLMSRRLSNGKTDFIVLHGVRTIDVGQGELVRRYIKQSLEENPGYRMATPVSCMEVELERVSERVA
jgi:hypothetical protein